MLLMLASNAQKQECLRKADVLLNYLNNFQIRKTICNLTIESHRTAEEITDLLRVKQFFELTMRVLKQLYLTVEENLSSYNNEDKFYYELWLRNLADTCNVIRDIWRKENTSKKYCEVYALIKLALPEIYFAIREATLLVNLKFPQCSNANSVAKLGFLTPDSSGKTSRSATPNDLVTEETLSSSAPSPQQ